MLKSIEKLLNTARGELGTKEVPANSNAVKYNTWYYGSKVSGPDYPWCSVFVLWCFHESGLADLAWGTLEKARKAVAEGARNWRALGVSKGRFVTGGYQPGDVVVFDWDKDGSIDHVGIVETVSADSKTVTCIEGNTSTTSTNNGGEVMRRSRNIDFVVGAYRPEFPGDSASGGEADKPDGWAAEACVKAVENKVFTPDASADYWHRAVNRQELAVVIGRLGVLK